MNEEGKEAREKEKEALEGTKEEKRGKAPGVFNSRAWYLSQHTPSVGPLPPEISVMPGSRQKAGPFYAGGWGSPGREASRPPSAPPGPTRLPAAPAAEEGMSGGVLSASRHGR